MIVETVLAGVFCVAVFYAHFLSSNNFRNHKFKIEHCTIFTS
jgi:hypothetical protein